jgi:hypothetical protein
MVSGVKAFLSVLITGDQPLKEMASGIFYNISANAEVREIMAKEYADETIKVLIRCLNTSQDDTQIKINIAGALWNLLLVGNIFQTKSKLNFLQTQTTNAISKCIHPCRSFSKVIE